MSVRGIIRLAPLLQLEDLDELRRRGREVYDFHTFKPLRADRTIPLCVDHDDVESVVGVVREFDYREAPEGGHWYYAHVRIDEPPAWLRRGTGRSFGSVLRRTLDMGGGLQRVVAMRVEEVTVCSPATVPLEPLARVEWLERSPARFDGLPRAGGSPVAVAAGSYRLAAADTGEATGIIRRPNTGRVLGVR